MTRVWWKVLIALGCIATPISATFAADGPLVATEVKQVDRDYWFQGEYLGAARGPCGRCETCGLQVVALGKNEFRAVLYRGGLPGGGWWTGMERHDLKGRRDDEVLMLGGPTRRVEIRDGKAIVSLFEPRSTSSGVLASDNAGSADGTATPIGELMRVQRTSQTLGARPPAGAIVLFDGSNTDHWKNGRMTDDKLLMIGTETKTAFRDFHMHVEFQLPYMPAARGQGRANSGVYIQSRYEVQVLDSFGLKGENNECAGLYKFKTPDTNLCFPPLVWQTYDIEFQSPRFDGAGKKICSGIISVCHNGVVVQNQVALENKTGGGAAEAAKALPTKLQDHGNPVRFRNIWLIERGCPSSASGAAPALADLRP